MDKNSEDNVKFINQNFKHKSYDIPNCAICLE